MSALWRATGPLLLTSTLAAAQLPTGLEARFVQHLANGDNGPSFASSELSFASTGHFLPGSLNRMGALVLREFQGQSKLIYLDSFGVWNTTNEHIVEIDTTDAALLPLGGPNGLDAVASINPFGLTIHEANAAGDAITAAAAFLGWFQLERVFTVGKGSGLFEIHGYDVQTGQMERVTYNSVSHSFTSMASYSAPAGLLGMTTFECDSSSGRELVYWTDQGDLVIKDATASVNIHTELLPAAAGEFRGVALLSQTGSSEELLVRNYVNAGNGHRKLRANLSTALVTNIDFDLGQGQDILSMAALDWDADGSQDLALGFSTGLPVVAHPGSVQVLPRPGGGSNLALTDVPFDLVQGALYSPSRPDLLMIGDADGDGDDDLFALGEAQSTVQHLLSSAALSMRPGHFDHSLVAGTAPSTKLTGSIDVVLPAGYSDTPAARLRLRTFALPDDSDEWDLQTSHSVMFDPPSGAQPGSTHTIPLTLDFGALSGWDVNEFTLLFHMAVVEVSGATTVAESATGILTIARGATPTIRLDEIIERFLFGEFSSAKGDGEATTGRPPGEPSGGGPPPSGTGG